MMIQNKSTLTLALTLMASCIYAQEPVDISRFVYDAAIADACVQGKAPEDTCAQFIANIELMMRLGDELQERATTITQNSGLTKITRGLRLHELWVKELLPKLRANQYNNEKVLDYECEHLNSLKKAKNRIEKIYRKVLLQHMATGPAMYWELMRFDRELSSDDHFVHNED